MAPDFGDAVPGPSYLARLYLSSGVYPRCILSHLISREIDQHHPAPSSPDPQSTRFRCLEHAAPWPDQIDHAGADGAGRYPFWPAS
jgi:hypothetical protein